MEGKLQEKFALLQQMKREKELKEAKAKESQPIDIFAIAGVALSCSGSTGGLSMTIRHDASTASGSTTVGSVKRPHKNRAPSTSNETIEESHQSQSPPATEVDDHIENSSGPKRKLKRSSMAVRNETQGGSSTSGPDCSIQSPDIVSESGTIRQSPEAPSVTEADDRTSKNSAIATPPTPVPSPKAEIASRRNSESASCTKILAKDMTHNVQSRSGSIDENEEMVIDAFGRSVPRSRHHSSDEGSDSEDERAHPRRRRRLEEDLSRYRTSYRSSRYDSRSRSRSRSRSPGRYRHYRRSRSRSVSPYNYSYSRDDGDRRRRGGGGERREHGRDGRDRSSDEMPPLTPAEEADPYLAASRYLDTAFYPTKIYVGNLPNSISLTTLRTLFSPFGDIEDMNLVEGKDFGFVTYVEPAAAQQALVQMNGAILDGTLIRVNRAKIPERNRRGFAGVAWMDEDGELARLEEEQHQQAAVATTRVPRGISNNNGHPSKRKLSSSDEACAAAAARPSHPYPVRPRSPKLPPKPTGAAMYPPVGMDPRAATVAGRGRQILRYDDL